MAFAGQTLVDAFAPELAIRPGPDLSFPASTLVVDYHLGRLLAVRRASAEFREVEVTDGSFARVLLEAHPYDPREQLRRDLRTLATSPSHDLRCGILVRQRKLSRSLARLIEELFESVQCQRDGQATLIVGASPRTPAEGRRQDPTILVTDPLIGRSYELATWPGLFSGEGLDPGTELLIATLPRFEEKAVLDLGCGYGPLSVTSAGRGAQVTFADVDARALRLTGENLKRHGLFGTPLATTNLSETADASFDVAISNPPTHAGSQALQTLFAAMVRVARPGGSVLLVVRAHLNYEKWLDPPGKVSRRADAVGYKVLSIEKD